MANIQPAKWKCRSDEHNISIYVELGSSGGVILSKPNNQKEFVFAQSKISTIREFGRMFIDIARWAEEEHKKISGNPMG